VAGKHTMPIIPFLEGRVFWPETTRAMGEVFEKARAMLGLADKTDSATALLAMEMTALAAMGIHDDVLLCRSRPAPTTRAAPPHRSDFGRLGIRRSRADRWA